MDLPLIVATIVAKIKARNGVTIDEAHLAEAITEGLKRIKTQDEQKYLHLIAELTEQVEILSKHVGTMRNQAQFAQHHDTM